MLVRDFFYRPPVTQPTVARQRWNKIHHNTKRVNGVYTR